MKDLLVDQNTPEVKKVGNIVDKNADIGLRTLILTEKVLKEEEYEKFNEEFTKASNLLKGREEEVDKVAASMEKELEIIGSTAIEDLLQENVSDTIVSLKNAGIKVWVLTGDKVGTAINIGITCGLLDNSEERVEIREIRHSEILGNLEGSNKKIDLVL